MRRILVALSLACFLFPSVGKADVKTYTVSENQTQPVIMEGVGLVAGTFLLCEQPDTFFPAKGTCGHLANGRFIQGNVSDSIVFSVGKIAGTISIAFCSDGGPKDNDDAFCGATPAVTGAFGKQESGIEYQLEGTDYAPTTTQPGYATVGSDTIQYVLISDTPESSTLPLLGGGLLLLFSVLRLARRRQR